MMLFTAATFTILFIVLTLFPMLADEFYSQDYGP